MHDCPTCRVPLHGHEEECPSCGTRQYVKPEFRGGRNSLPPPPGINPMPIIIGVLIIGGMGIFFAKSSWIGQVLTNPPPKDDPIATMNFMDARSKIEQQISSGLTAIGTKGSFKYTVNEQPAFKNTAGPVALTVETAITDAEQRKPIIDPIKDYFGPAKITTLTVNDAPRHRTWTYTASTMPSTDPNAPTDQGATPTGEAPADANAAQ